MGVVSRRSAGKRAEAEQNMSEELWSRRKETGETGVDIQTGDTGGNI